MLNFSMSNFKYSLGFSMYMIMTSMNKYRRFYLPFQNLCISFSFFDSLAKTYSELNRSVVYKYDCLIPDLSFFSFKKYFYNTNKNIIES